MGRQELNAENPDRRPWALWTVDVLDGERAQPGDQVPTALYRGETIEMMRIVVAVDPSGTKGDGKGDDVGIVVAGKSTDGRFYVLADLTSQLSPDGWARRVIDAYRTFKADPIVAERNFGGAMV